MTHQEWPTEYLGLPLGGSSRKKELWNQVWIDAKVNFLDGRLITSPLAIESLLLKPLFQTCQFIVSPNLKFLKALRRILKGFRTNFFGKVKKLRISFDQLANNVQGKKNGGLALGGVVKRNRLFWANGYGVIR